jgi:hypothetical protein
MKSKHEELELHLYSKWDKLPHEILEEITQNLLRITHLHKE